MNPRKQKFADSYLLNGSATQAAKDAGYSVKTAYSQGPRLLKDVEVASYLAKAKAKASDAAGIDALRVLQEFALIATSDVGDYFNEDGAFKKLGDIPPEKRRAIASLDVEAESEKHGRVLKLKLWPKTDALDKIARILGQYEKDNSQGAQSFAELVLQAGKLRGKR